MVDMNVALGGKTESGFQSVTSEFEITFMFPRLWPKLRVWCGYYTREPKRVCLLEVEPKR